MATNPIMHLDQSFLLLKVNILVREDIHAENKPLVNPNNANMTITMTHILISIEYMSRDQVILRSIQWVLIFK